MGKKISSFKDKHRVKETMSYVGITCPKCGSPKIIKEDHECGRVAECFKLFCTGEGCKDYVSSKGYAQRFTCLNCGNKWSLLRNY